MSSSPKKYCYLISYDVSGESGSPDYTIIDAIKSYKGWAHITESTWAVVSDKSHTEIRDDLSEYLPKGSRLFVLKSGGIAAWRNVICSNKWLKENI